MRVLKPLLLMFCLGVFVLSVPLSAKADEWDKQTTLTFNKPVEVPGMVLRPGAYEFRLADVASERNVVQIFNADGSHLYENVLTIPAYRLEPTDKTVITFEERVEGAPEAIKDWFYPGDNSGVEFVYAKATAPAVAALPAVKPPETRSKPTTPEPSVSKAEPVQTPVQIAQAPTPPTPAATPVAPTPQKETPKKLPKTASPVPFLILIGLLSLGGAAGVQVYSNRSV